MKKWTIFLSIILLLIGAVNTGQLFLKRYNISKMSKLLIIAIEDNDYDEVKIIIDKEPESINSLPSMSPWFWQLITEQPSVSFPLQEACLWGRYDIVKLLLEKGADCNLVWKGINGSKSPLMCAVISNTEESEAIIELLLQQGANKTYIDECGKSAYDYAVESKNIVLQNMLK